MARGWSFSHSSSTSDNCTTGTRLCINILSCLDIGELTEFTLYENSEPLLTFSMTAVLVAVVWLVYCVHCTCMDQVVACNIKL